jgi:hypothetical protein
VRACLARAAVAAADGSREMRRPPVTRVLVGGYVTNRTANGVVTEERSGLL